MQTEYQPSTPHHPEAGASHGFPSAPQAAGDGGCHQAGTDPACVWHTPVQLAHITTHRAAMLDQIANYEHNHEIAAALGIAESTAKHEVEQLRDLTGCASKPELARWWLAHRQVWQQATGRG